MDGLPLTPQDTDLRHILCPIFVRSRLVGSCGPPGTVRFHPTPSYYGMRRWVPFRLSPLLLFPCVIVALPGSAARERKPPTSGETALEHGLHGEGSPTTVDDRVCRIDRDAWWPGREPWGRSPPSRFEVPPLHGLVQFIPLVRSVPGYPQKAAGAAESFARYRVQ